MLKNTISLVILTFCLTCFTNLLSEPHRVFGDEGTFLYSNPMHELLGIHSILGGEEVMVFWSENRLEDGLRGIYLQIVNEAGEFRFENPIQLSQNNMTTDGGKVAEDSEGNLFVAWSATIPVAGAEKILFVQKYDSNGNTLWGDEPRNLITFETEVNSKTLIGLIPDDQGGVYALSNWGFLAIDENCQFRRDWEWNERRPDPQHNKLLTAISDGLGGFWYSSTTRPLMNRISYEGDKLWDQMCTIANDEFPEGALIDYPMCGLNGGLVLLFNHPEGSGIFLMDENGEFAGDEFTHIIQEDGGRLDFHIEKLRDDRIAMLYELNPSDSDEGDEAWLTIYDPGENEFVNSNRGVRVNTWNSSLVNVCNIIELANGDLLLGIDPPTQNGHIGEYYLYSTELERRWRNVVQIPGFAGAIFGVGDANNGAWLFGQDRCSYPRRQPYMIYKLDQAGNIDDHWPTLPILSNRKSGFSAGCVWSSENGYNNLFAGVSNWEGGMIHMSIDSSGHVTGDLEGENLIDIDLTSDFDYQISANRILMGWSSQVSGLPVLMCFNDDAEFEWEIEFDRPDIEREAKMRIDLAPNGNFAYLLARSSDEEPVHYFLSAVNCATGELAWSDSFPVNINRTGTEHWILAEEDGVYLIYMLIGSHIEIRKYDTEGNLEWEQPYRTDVNEPDDLLIGVSKRSDGGMWYGKLKRGFSQFNVEFHAVDENGEEVDNVLLLSEEPIRSNGNINGIEFSIPGNSGPLWIFREDDHLEGEMLVQCISEDGERLLGENGFGHFEMPEYQHVQGCSDGNGGLWFTWRKYVYSILSVIHFNGDGEMMEGWTEEGIDAFQTPFTATYTYVYPMGENLAIISNNRDYNPFKTLEDNWVMQVLSDREPRFIDNPGTMGTPENHSLLNLYPNPFNSTTRIEYNLPNNGHTRIAIYNLNGCQMDILTNGELAAGIYATSWDASGVPTGVYLCRLEAGGETVTRKLMVLR